MISNKENVFLLMSAHLKHVTTILNVDDNYQLKLQREHMKS
jgi:hypothetical protein